MNSLDAGSTKELPENEIFAGQRFEQAADEIFEQALSDAKMKLHPLLRNREMCVLERRVEFVQEFKHALARRVAQKVAAWEPEIEAIFQFDETWMENRASWDGSIHLLVKVPRLSNGLDASGKGLDPSLLRRLIRAGWTCFRNRQSMLELQQVTTEELRHCIGYGAMFCAVYSVPVEIWPDYSKSTVVG